MICQDCHGLPRDPRIHADSCICGPHMKTPDGTDCWFCHIELGDWFRPVSQVPKCPERVGLLYNHSYDDDPEWHAAWARYAALEQRQLADKSGLPPGTIVVEDTLRDPPYPRHVVGYQNCYPGCEAGDDCHGVRVELVNPKDYRPGVRPHYPQSVPCTATVTPVVDTVPDHVAIPATTQLTLF